MSNWVHDLENELRRTQIAATEYLARAVAAEAELSRLRLVAKDAKALLNSANPKVYVGEYGYQGLDAGCLAALAESLAAWERGEDVDEEDIGK